MHRNQTQGGRLTRTEDSSDDVIKADLLILLSVGTEITLPRDPVESLQAVTQKWGAWIFGSLLGLVATGIAVLFLMGRASRLCEVAPTRAGVGWVGVIGGRATILGLFLPSSLVLCFIGLLLTVIWLAWAGDQPPDGISGVGFLVACYVGLGLDGEVPLGGNTDRADVPDRERLRGRRIGKAECA